MSSIFHINENNLVAGDREIERAGVVLIANLCRFTDRVYKG